MRLVTKLDPKLAVQDVDALIRFLMDVKAWPGARGNFELSHGDRPRHALSDGPYPPQSRGHAEAGWSAAFDNLATILAT